MLIFRKFTQLLLVCMALLLCTATETSAQTGIVGEELIRIKMTVSRKTSPGTEIERSINQVPRLNPGDKLNIGVVDEDIGDENFNSRGYRGLIVIFIPTSKLNVIYEQRRFTLETRKLRTSNASIDQRLRNGTLNENVNGGRCFTKCTFTVPSYSSIPIVFFISDENNPVAKLLNGGYRNDLKEFVVFSGPSPADNRKRINNYETLLDLGNHSVNLTVLPKKIQFLIDAKDILATEKAENTKVLQSLSDRAFKYFDLGKDNECGKEKGVTLKETVTKQFQCLSKSEHFDIAKFAGIRNKLNWKDVTEQLAGEGIAQLKAKIPSLDAYLVAAQLIIELIEPFLRAQPLVISSAIAGEDNVRPTIYSLYANPEMESNEPTGPFSRAVFFVPFSKRLPETVFQNAEVAMLKPTPLIPCITPGLNNLFFVNNTLVST